MLDNLISLVKDQVLDTISQNADIPADKKDSAIETTTSTIVDGLKQQFSSGGLSSITSLFGGASSGASSIFSTLGNLVESALVSKVGLSKEVANSIASTAIPAVMNFISQKSQDPNDSFSIDSLLGSLGSESKGASGILSKLSSLFGK